MNQPVYIAGKGVISAIGSNTQECLASLVAGEAGIGPMQLLQTVHSGALPVAEVKYNNAQLAALAGMPETTSRTALLSLLAAREALADAGLETNTDLRTGFISANSVGGMDKTEDFFTSFVSNNAKGRLRAVVNHECGAVTELVADRLGIKDYITTISTACSSGANAIFVAARLIRHNLLDVAIAGGTDALTRFTLNGFNTLMILDGQLCQPFDENRRGLNLGEGAGYLVLVSEKVAATLSRQPVSRLGGCCNANDAFHQTASSPDGNGSYLAMRGALTKAGLAPADIGYINLHGTGTQNNDLSEGRAIQKLFAPYFPPMSSTKAFTGHTLGASGGMEAVFSVLALEKGLLYPSLRLQTPMSDLPFEPLTTLQQHSGLRHVMPNSFGFGGNCTSLVFSKI